MNALLALAQRRVRPWAGVGNEADTWFFFSGVDVPREWADRVDVDPRGDGLRLPWTARHGGEVTWDAVSDEDGRGPGIPGVDFEMKQANGLRQDVESPDMGAGRQGLGARMFPAGAGGDDRHQRWYGPGARIDTSTPDELVKMLELRVIEPVERMFHTEIHKADTYTNYNTI